MKTLAALLPVLFLIALAEVAAAAPPSFADPVEAAQPKMVKIYGAGGLRGLEAYQSGFLISPDGHVLTVWSYVLDSDVVGVTLHDGRKFEAKLVGADPRLEIALLKIPASNLSHFALADAVSAEPGTRVLALCNLFGVATGDEPVSVLRGVVSARTPLGGRRGSYITPYRGPVYVLDAITNNPGAAGGALLDRQGRLLGLLGKELRNARNNIWLNYALPIAELNKSVDDILAGKILPRATEELIRPERPLTLAALGIVLVPDVLARTPPFVDLVRGGSPAAEAGIRPDDLLIFVNDRLVQSCRQLRDELALLEIDLPVKLTLMRGQQLQELTLEADVP